jgi:hypothetical protein
MNLAVPAARRRSRTRSPLYLRPGIHPLKFIVDDQWRYSEDMPTATDDDTSNVVNYVDGRLPCGLFAQPAFIEEVVRSTIPICIKQVLCGWGP